MRRTSNRPGPRPGFTLVELLVVMTIIAILFALTAAAVVKAIGKSDEVRTRNDISQLQTAVQAFKTDFGVAYLPSQITLPPACDPTGQSSQYISSLWPRMPAIYVSQNTPTVPPAAFTFWGVPSQYTQGLTLSGDQCLVFFLGGAILGGSPVGFSTSPTNPMDTSGSTGANTRKGPYFPFPPMTGNSTDRLKQLVSGNPFPSFIDIYGAQPYLYFSAGKSGNDYPVPTSGPKPFVTFIEYSNASKTSVVSIRYVNPNGFQIVAAGRDGTFGPGLDSWPGATIKIDSPLSTSAGATDMNGYDDVANFHPTLLGVPAQ